MLPRETPPETEDDESAPVDVPPQGPARTGSGGSSWRGPRAEARPVGSPATAPAVEGDASEEDDLADYETPINPSPVKEAWGGDGSSSGAAASPAAPTPPARKPPPAVPGTASPAKPAVVPDAKDAKVPSPVFGDDSTSSANAAAAAASGSAAATGEGNGWLKELRSQLKTGTAPEAAEAESSPLSDSSADSSPQTPA